MESNSRSSKRVPLADWAEVVSYPGGYPMAVGHVRNISEGGLAMEFPVRISPGTQIQIRLSTVTDGLLRNFQFTGTVVHAESVGPSCLHGMKFTALNPSERTALTDYLCQVEYHYRMAS